MTAPTNESIARTRGTPSERSAEARLVDRVKRRDPSAAADLFDAYAGLLMALARAIVKNEADADEIVEDTIVQFWHAPDGWTPEKGSLAVYLSVMARGRALDLLRKRRRRTELLDRAAAVASPGSVFEPVTPPQPDDLYEQRERRARARAALETLTDKQREALSLAYFDGLTQAEIAVRLDTPLGTIKTRMRDGMIALRSHFAEQSGGQP